KAKHKVADVASTAGCATRFLRKRNVKSFALLPRCDSDAITVAQSAVQGAITSQFELDKYKTKDKNEKSVTNFVVCIEGAKPGDVSTGAKRGQAIGESINFTRDLANEPPNILHPTELAACAQAMAMVVGVKFEVLDEAKM